MRIHKLPSSLFALSLILLSCPGILAQNAAPEPDLISSAEPLVDPFAATTPAIQRSRAISIDISLLATLTQKERKVYRIGLFGDKVFRARFERREDLSPGSYNWFGSLLGHPGSSFVLSVYDGAVAAAFFPEDGSRLSLAIQGAPGMHVVRELDPKGSKCGALPFPMGQQTFGPQAAGCSDNPDDIRVMIVYDKGARFWAGSHAKVVAEVQKSIAIANNANSASILRMRFNLTSVRPVNYTTGGWMADLDRLTYTKGQKVKTKTGYRIPDPAGYLDEIHAWRLKDKADLVQLVVGFNLFLHGSTLGIAWTPSYSYHLNPSSGFGVTLYLPIDPLTMTHEFGHNFGCNHDRKNVPKTTTLLYPYALGFKYFKLFGANFTTVMGYPELFQGHLGAWSTPGVQWKGVPIGSTKAANNRQVILNTRQKLADYSRVLDFTNRAPTFTRRPTTLIRCQGYQTQPVLMSVAARGASSYQWYHGSKALAGQTSTNLVLRDLTSAHAGRYHCVAANACGKTLSGYAYLRFYSSCRTRRFTTTGTSTAYGSSVSRAGDVNRDGYEDFVIGEPRSKVKGSDSGRFEVRSGKDSSILMNISHGASEQLGYCVSAAGDVDQDGYADIIVGAPYGSSRRGIARVYSGRTKKVLHLFTVIGTYSYFGMSVCGAGDLDGDGHPDLVVGAPVRGLVRAYSGKTGKILWSLVAKAKTDRLGQAVAPAGDLNQDGFDDVLVGAPGGSGFKGYVRLVSGRNGASLGTVYGSLNKGYLGWSVASLGDINKDGVPDFAAGAPYASIKSSSGFMAVFSGKDRKLLWSKSYGPGERLGWSIAAAGDVNSDGIPDLHVGAPIYRSGYRSGYVQTLSGKDGAQLAIRFGSGKAGFGMSVSGFEANGDAMPDLLVGQPYEGRGGAVWLFDGPLAINPPEVEFYGAACFNSKKTLPRMSLSGRPAIGKIFRPQMHAASPNSACILSIDVKRSNIGLGALGATGCTLYAMPLWSLVTVTDAAGRSNLGLPIPYRAGFIGGQLHMQWLLIDLAANGLGIVPSTAVRIRIGRQ